MKTTSRMLPFAALGALLPVACGRTPSPAADPTPAARVEAPNTAPAANTVPPDTSPATTPPPPPLPAPPPSAPTPPPVPGTDEHARSLLLGFLEPGADAAALTRALRPRYEELVQVFGADSAGAALRLYDPLWAEGLLVVAPRPEQDAVEVLGTTTDELILGTGAAARFPAGYRRVAGRLGAGLRWVRFWFRSGPDDDSNAWDGLVWTGERWVLVPKPWRVFEGTGR